MDILSLGKHPDCFFALLGEGYLVQGHQVYQVLGVFGESSIHQDTEGASLVVQVAQLEGAKVQGTDELGELGLEGGAYGWGWRGVDLEGGRSEFMGLEGKSVAYGWGQRGWEGDLYSDLRPSALIPVPCPPCTMTYTMPCLYYDL